MVTVFSRCIALRFPTYQEMHYDYRCKCIRIKLNFVPPHYKKMYGTHLLFHQFDTFVSTQSPKEPDVKKPFQAFYGITSTYMYLYQNRNCSTECNNDREDNKEIAMKPSDELHVRHNNPLTKNSKYAKFSFVNDWVDDSHYTAQIRWYNTLHVGYSFWMNYIVQFDRYKQKYTAKWTGLDQMQRKYWNLFRHGPMRKRYHWNLPNYFMYHKQNREEHSYIHSRMLLYRIPIRCSTLVA